MIGELRLRLGVKEGRTVIRDVYNRVPLKIAKPFYLEPESGEIFIYQMNPAGGMVQGDDYQQYVELEPGAKAFLTTQSATRVYRTPDGFAQQGNYFTLGKGAALEFFPDPVIPFAGSRFIGETEVHLTSLSPGARRQLSQRINFPSQ
ncbi:MAG TPA: urease accessory protein UreD [Bacillota bacterium]|nr:urease accessory protein UreD [Bacillota bacterium]